MTKRTSALAISLLVACGFASAQPQQASGSGTSSTSSRAKSGSNSKSGSSSKKKTSGKKHYAKREPTQKAPTPDRIAEIQSALARNGYYQGQPNGKWDANTVAAMQKFQSDNGLDATGKLDALSLQKLGLGSSVAGVSAPKPPVPATAAPSNPAPGAAPAAKPSANSSGAMAQTASSAALAAKQQ